ncbi:MAG: carbon-nitrogen hydrolase [Bermanella sp.]|nr:carbon-nitrogen hydrolase [Bermanella sp.]
MRCAVIQMTSGKDVDANLMQAEVLLKQASEKDADLVVLPEMFACLGVTNQFELACNRFTPEDVIHTVLGWAKQFKLNIVAGSVPLIDESNKQSEKVLAASLVCSRDGEIMAQYNKIHLFDVNVADEKGRYKESDTFIAGNDAKTVMVDGHQLGLSVCYDVRFPELYQQYQSQGCELITVPSAFTYETGRVHWEILLRARAIETQSFVLAANQVGVHEDGRKTWGQSMIVAPNGEILAQGDNEKPQVIFADLDFDFLEQCRANMPIQQHKKLT